MIGELVLMTGVVVSQEEMIGELVLMTSVVSEEESWMTGETDHVVAQAVYSFSGQGEEELSFSAGQQIILAPKGEMGVTGSFNSCLLPFPASWG